MITIGSHFYRSFLTLQHGPFLKNSLPIQAKSFCKVSHAAQAVVKNTSDLAESRLHDIPEKDANKVSFSSFLPSPKDHTRAQSVSKILAKKLKVPAEQIPSIKNHYGPLISKALLDKLDDITILDQEQKLKIDVDQLTDEEIKVSLSLPLGRNWSENTSTQLYRRLHEIHDRQDAVEYANPELDLLIQVNKGHIKNIDDFDLGQLKYRLSKNLLDAETAQKVYDKFCEIREQNYLTPEDLLEEDKKLEESPYLSAHQEILDQKLDNP